MRFGLLLVENYLAYARVTQDHYLEQHPSDDEKSYGGSRTSSTNNALKGDSNSCQGAGSTSTLPCRKTDGSDFLFRPDLWVPNPASRRDFRRGAARVAHRALLVRQ